MWGINSVLGPHASTHFPTSSPLPSHIFSPHANTLPHSPHTLSHTLPTLLHSPHIFPYLPPHPNTFSYISPHTPHISSHSSPDLPLHPNTLPYSPLCTLPHLSPHILPHSFAYVAMLPSNSKSPIKFFTATGNLKFCFGVGNVNFRCMKVWRSYCGEVIGNLCICVWRSGAKIINLNLWLSIF